MSKHAPGEAKRERRMNAYYYSFTETGVDPVDDILEKVAMAGKGLHNTDGWAEKLEWMENKSYVDLIQESAVRSAEAFSAIKTQRDELLAALQNSNSALCYCLAILPDDISGRKDAEVAYDANCAAINKATAQ